jgi:hypothetical protein
MRLDHVTYVASHDQISDVANRIGSQIGTAFVDGGIHPKFGTRNLTAPLLNGQYIEIVCPLDHPATDSNPFGRAVKAKAREGGGWLTWVYSVNSIERIENNYNEKISLGSRRKPSGETLEWKQIGMESLNLRSSNPYFIEWISESHPSLDGKPEAKIFQINFSCANIGIKPWILNTINSSETKLNFKQNEIETDEIIDSIEFVTADGIIAID